MNKVIIEGRISNLSKLLWAGKKHRRKVFVTEEINGRSVTHIVMLYDEKAEQSLYIGDRVLVHSHMDEYKAFIVDTIEVLLKR